MWLTSKSGRDLVLARRHLVVPRLDRHAEAVELELGVGHEGQHPGRDGAEVVVLELLPLGRPGAEEGPLAGHQVGPLEEELPVDQEVLLLRAHRGEDPGDPGVGAEELEDAERLLGERLHRAEEGDLGVERLAGPRDEGGRDAEGDVVLAADQEGRAGRVPGGVAAGLEGGAEAARREARGVRLALHQLGAGEVEDDPARAVGAHQRIVLLGGEAGQRLEPVGEVGGAVLDGPVLHRGGHDVGHLGVERLAPVDGPDQALEDLLGEALAHHAPGEDVLAIHLVDAVDRGGHGVPRAGGSEGTGGGRRGG